MTDVAKPEQATTPAATDRWATAAAWSVTAAGAGHLLAALEHLGHDVRYAVFFLGVGAVLVCLGPRLRHGVRPAAGVLMLAAMVALVLLHLYTRTVGLQLGPHADRPEDPALLGIAVVVVELVAVAAVAAMLPRRLRSGVVNGLFALGLGVWVLWLTGALV